MIVDVITIFPQIVDSVLSASVLGIARDRGLVEVRCHDLRDWTTDRHRTTDDAPYGGGPGMVMKPEPLFDAVEAVQSMGPCPGTVIIFTPAGTTLTHETSVALSSHERLILVCGRYEGIDERVLTLADMQVSIGDYVLTGGELPAMVLIDAVSRHVPGVLGDAASAADETFSDDLLEYPQYTRPAVYRGMEVPEVLRSGDHARIAAWRREQAIVRTARLRPDLIERAALSETERARAEAEIARTRDEGGS